MHFAPTSLRDTVRAIDGGTLDPAGAIRASLERIEAVEGEIGAFASRAQQALPDAGAGARGPLRGVTIGIKDIFDTADMPTEYGSSIYAGNQTRSEAALVAMARGKGAAILGKTTTTEFAFFKPTRTLNPNHPEHTPGGSSSGSAAAVASGMLAGAFGSQTGGSVIRPAAFCGIAGYKPSFRLLPTVGMKTFSWSLDTAGLFAGGVADVALLAALLTGRDLAVPDDQPAGLRIGLYRSDVDDRLEPAMQDAVARAAKALEAAGARLVEISEPAALSEARRAHGTVQDFEAAQALGFERAAHPDALSGILRETLEKGAAIAPQTYDDARRIARDGRRATTALFEDVDALLVASAPGAAPRSLETTGDSVMNRLWTLMGVPCVNVPGLRDPGGMPLGVSIVTRFGRDREALRIAALLESALCSK